MAFPTLLQAGVIVEAIPPATDAAGRASDWISLKNVAGKAYIVVQITQGNSATVTITPQQATNVSGASAKAIPAVPIWANLDTAAGETMVRRTDAANYTTDAGVKNKIVVFEIEPSALDVENGFDCLNFTTGASNVANITAGMFVLPYMRFGGATPQAVTTN